MVFLPIVFSCFAFSYFIYLKNNQYINYAKFLLYFLISFLFLSRDRFDRSTQPALTTRLFLCLFLLLPSLNPYLRSVCALLGGDFMPQGWCPRPTFLSSATGNKTQNTSTIISTNQYNNTTQQPQQPQHTIT